MMMKHIIFTGALLLASAVTGEAMADCSTNQVVNVTSGAQNLTTLLTDHTVCDATAKYDTSIKHPGTGGLVVMGIQEEHRADGQLWDFKKGPSNPVDPTTQVGTWSVAGADVNTEVTYFYGATQSGPYKVYSTGASSYDFCSGTTQVASVTVVNSIGVGC
jgi:hypothetical protein